MGNSGSSSNHNRRRNSSPIPNPGPSPNPSQNPNPNQQPEIPTNRYVFAAATPYPNPNSPPFYQYSGFYPPPPPPIGTLPAPLDHHHRNGVHQPSWTNAEPNVNGGRYQCAGSHKQPTAYVEHQKAVTIKNDVNLKKETMKVVPDELDLGKFLVAFSFDAMVAGSITLYFFAKEGFACNLNPTKNNLLNPITVYFKEGLGQNFIQPSGTGIDFSLFDESELKNEGEPEIYPIAVKAEASLNSQITQAVVEVKGKGKYHARVVKQILWANDKRYELQEIYGIGSSIDGDIDVNDPGKECVICLSEPRDTAVLPCRHMCLCNGCAKVLRFQTTRCPICRQLVERFLEIRVDHRSKELQDQEELDNP